MISCGSHVSILLRECRLIPPFAGHRQVFPTEPAPPLLYREHISPVCNHLPQFLDVHLTFFPHPLDIRRTLTLIHTRTRPPLQRSPVALKDLQHPVHSQMDASTRNMRIFFIPRHFAPHLSAADYRRT